MAESIPPRSWITCDQGHRICFTEEGLHVGQHLNEWATRLTEWQQREPKIGEPFTDWVCAKCGRAWWPIRKWEAADA